MVAVLLAPVVQHFLHRFHLELDERRSAADAVPRRAAATGAACSLPAADRSQRTADFRALFADAFVDRARSPHGVRWMLRATEGTESESRRLAALEARCCDGVRFEVERLGDRVLWEIRGPASAQATLDAFYELPMLVRSDDGARALWDALDARRAGRRLLFGRRRLESADQLCEPSATRLAIQSEAPPFRNDPALVVALKASSP